MTLGKRLWHIVGAKGRPTWLVWNRQETVEVFQGDVGVMLNRALKALFKNLDVILGAM